MNKEYGSTNEENDYKLLEEFNKFLKLEDLGRCPSNAATDASGHTTDGRYVNIELKRRFIDIGTYSSIYLETHKCGDMLLDYVVDNKIPLYINFLDDGYVVTFNLAELKHRPKKVEKKIYSKLYDGFEIAKRVELLIEDAWVYQKINDSYKLLQKPR